MLKVVDQIYDTYNRWIGRNVDVTSPFDMSDAAKTHFIYDGNQIILQFDDTQPGDLTNRYLWGPAVDQILADEQYDAADPDHDDPTSEEGAVLWPLTDHLGTVRDIAQHDATSGTALLVNHLEYNSFGLVTSETDPSVDLLFLYTARPFDEATGLQNNLNRWYDILVGAWISEDPIGFRGGDTNLGRYVRNASSILRDPTGLYTLRDFFGYLQFGVQYAIPGTSNWRTEDNPLVIDEDDIFGSTNTVHQIKRDERWQKVNAKVTKKANAIGKSFIDEHDNQSEPSGTRKLSGFKGKKQIEWNKEYHWSEEMFSPVFWLNVATLNWQVDITVSWTTNLRTGITTYQIKTTINWNILDQIDATAYSGTRLNIPEGGFEGAWNDPPSGTGVWVPSNEEGNPLEGTFDMVWDRMLMGDYWINIKWVTISYAVVSKPRPLSKRELL